MRVLDIAIVHIWFQPLFAWLGLLTLLLLIGTAVMGYSLIKGWMTNIKLHQGVAALTLTVGLVHAILALSTIMVF